MTTPESKPLALVTGASSGIGLELARQFGENGFDLVITAEDAGLSAAAAALRSTGADVQSVQVDLRTPDGVRQLYATATAGGRALDAVALSAGVGQGGAFIDTDLVDDQEIIDLDITSTVHLAKLVLRDMAARDAGRVLITSSIASTMPGAFQAVYNASKSFLQSFAEAVQEELAGTRVTVTSLMPGPTDTNFFHRAEMDDTPVGRGSKDDPAQVAAQGFAALMDGKNTIVAGSLKTKAQGALDDVLPDKVKATAHRRMAEPKN
jgi:short-subunit dehydrogenase